MRTLIFFLLVICGVAQTTDDPSRAIWDTGFREQRPTASPSQSVVPSRPAIRYRTARPPTSPATGRVPSPAQQPPSAPAPSIAQRVAPPAAQPTAALGITIWKLREAKHGYEMGARLLVQAAPDRQPSEYIPERIRIGAPLRVGDQVRLSIESPRPGFLYVINRERYRDGGFGRPHLIFPVANLNGGDNRVGPGRLIEIPGQRDRVPALVVERRDPRHAGEELIFIVSPERFSFQAPATPAEPLSTEVLKDWENRCSTAEIRLDLASDPAPWTAVEKEAGVGARLLTQADPMPESIYATAAIPDQPLLVRVALEVH